MSHKKKNLGKAEHVRRGRRLAKQLATYSVAAASGAFAVDQANASVVSTILPSSVFVNASTVGTYKIDLDGNGVNDFEVGYAAIGDQHLSYLNGLVTAGGYPGGNRSRTRARSARGFAPKYPKDVVVSSEPGVGNPREKGAQGAGDGFNSPNGMQSDTGFSDIWGGRKFNYLTGVYYGGGGNIGGSVRFTVSENTGGAATQQAGKWFTTTTSGIQTDEAGGNGAAAPGYIPIQFLIDPPGAAPSEIHYGWIKAQMYFLPAPDEGTVEILGWGYESDAHVSILTGALATTAEAVPEPATLTMLALGAAGLGGLVWRRRMQRDTN